MFQKGKCQGQPPAQKIEASFDIVEYQQSQTTKTNKIDQDMKKQDQMQSIINECELLNMAYEVGE